MPVLSWAHSAYWATQVPETPVTPPGAAVGGYPQWQTSVIIGSGFGASQVIWDWLRDRRVTTTQEK